jgi:2'-5' RNA ligase
MAQGVVLQFDHAASEAVRGCWRALETAGVPSLESFTHGRHEPHVTLVVADRLVEGAWLDTLRNEFFAGDPIQVRLTGVSTFPGGWVYLAVDGLPLAGQSRLVSSLGREAEGIWEHYLPEQWVPHCTIAGGLTEQQAAAAAAIVRTGRPPSTATIVATALIDTETGNSQRLPV